MNQLETTINEEEFSMKKAIFYHIILHAIDYVRNETIIDALNLNPEYQNAVQLEMKAEEHFHELPLSELQIAVVRQYIDTIEYTTEISNRINYIQGIKDCIHLLYLLYNTDNL